MEYGTKFGILYLENAKPLYACIHIETVDFGLVFFLIKKKFVCLFVYV